MKPLTMKQLCQLMDDVYKNHSVIHSYNNKRNSKRIKYVDPVIDMRTETCFTITFRGFGSAKTFSSTNDFSCDNRELYDVIKDWLDSKVEQRKGDDRRSFNTDVNYIGLERRENIERRHPTLDEDD